mmetsp:Transcript_43785/g.115654  ORF Transcript_43785/g.115654 Transcript_43785/m.115654 type:complete len:211 (-) Transcript_43785:1028-1660(-)
MATANGEVNNRSMAESAADSHAPAGKTTKNCSGVPVDDACARDPRTFSTNGSTTASVKGGFASNVPPMVSGAIVVSKKEPRDPKYTSRSPKHEQYFHFPPLVRRGDAKDSTPTPATSEMASKTEYGTAEWKPPPSFGPGPHMASYRHRRQKTKSHVEVGSPRKAAAFAIPMDASSCEAASFNTFAVCRSALARRSKLTELMMNTASPLDC